MAQNSTKNRETEAQLDYTEAQKLLGAVSHCYSWKIAVGQDSTGSRDKLLAVERHWHSQE